MATKYTKWPFNICTNIFHCKSLQYLPKVVFLVGKYAIWQPCIKKGVCRVAEALYVFASATGDQSSNPAGCKVLRNIVIRMYVLLST
jgi:hypothetical protein